MPPQSGGIWVASQTVTKRLSRWCIHVLPDTVPRWSNFGCFDSVRQDEGAQTKLDSVNDQSYWIYYMKIYRLYTVSDYLKKTINNVWSSLHTYNLYGLAVEQWKKGMSTWIGMDLVPCPHSQPLRCSASPTIKNAIDWHLKLIPFEGVVWKTAGEIASQWSITWW